jgi:hypothetical protein
VTSITDHRLGNPGDVGLFARYGWTDDRETNRRKGGDFARRALEGAEYDPVVLANAGYVLELLGRRVRQCARCEELCT